MRILYSFWGFVTPFDKQTVSSTPDHYRGGRVDLVDEMQSRGHTVVQVQKCRDDEPYPGVEYDDSGFPEGDVLFAEWRWPTWKNDESIGGDRATEPDYKRQCELLDHYHAKGVPIIIHDGDLKMTPEEELRWPNAQLADACIKPREQTRARISMPWVSSARRILNPVERPSNYTYVGNNYDRDPQFRKYYSRPSHTLRTRGIQTSVWGNWLERSPERRDPSDLLKENPHVAFGHRLAYKEIFGIINNSIAVTHITRDDYTPYGNITMRFTEAIQAGVVSLIPNEYIHARSVGLGEFLVNDPADVIRTVMRLSQASVAERTEIINLQEQALRKVVDFSPAHKIDMIEQHAKRG
jgi:hypothetical protein